METATIENPVIKADDGADLEALASAAARADAVGSSPVNGIPEPPSPEPVKEPETAAPSQDKQPVDDPLKTEEQQAAQSARERDEHGRFKPAQDKPEPALAADAKPAVETPYSKAQKERERQENVLRNFEAEKQRARAEIEAGRRQLQEERAQLEQARSGGGQRTFTSSDYAGARNDFMIEAKKAIGEGDMEKANEFLEHAEKAEIAAGQAFAAEQQKNQSQSQEQYNSAWTQNMARAIEEYKRNGTPEVADPESPLSKTLAAVLGEPDPVDPRLPNIFYRLGPDGFKYAVPFAKLRLDASDAAALRKENEVLRAENDKFKKLTSIAAGGPASRVPPKSPGNMNVSDLERYLQNEARKADAAGLSPIES